jgi:hypothetical protein
MSLAHALVGSSTIVMAADTYATSRDPLGMYGYRFSKLVLVNENRWVLGIAGSDSSRSIADELQRKAFAFDGQIDDAVLRYSKEMWSIRTDRGYRGDCWLLLAAFDGDTPCLYGWHFLDQPAQHSEFSKRLAVPISAIGARLHGAMYFSHAYHRSDMSDEELAVMAHFCVTEASNHDPRIDRPVDVALVRPEGARLLTAQEILALEQASSTLSSQIGDLLKQHALNLPHLSVL